MHSRTFSRKGDLKRHSERNKPLEEQRGSVRCPSCQRWFKSAGGLGIHKKKFHADELIFAPSTERTRNPNGKC